VRLHCRQYAPLTPTENYRRQEIVVARNTRTCPPRRIGVLAYRNATCARRPCATAVGRTIPATGWDLRRKATDRPQPIATFLSGTGAVTGAMRVGLNLVHGGSSVLGTPTHPALREFDSSGGLIQPETSSMPRGAARPRGMPLARRENGWATRLRNCGQSGSAWDRKLAAASRVSVTDTPGGGLLQLHQSRDGPGRNDADPSLTLIVELLQSGFRCLPRPLMLCCGGVREQGGSRRGAKAKARSVAEGLTK
jgi:hypothetical protein